MGIIFFHLLKASACLVSVASFSLSTKPLRRPQVLHSLDERLEADKTTKIVVIGNGMVGQRFMEKVLAAEGSAERFRITTFCEEPRAAYNRVKLTSYFETQDPSSLTMTEAFTEDGSTPWYKKNGVDLRLNDKAVNIDTDKKIITSSQGAQVPYDVAVLATGSAPFVPPIPGNTRPGVFVYRTIEDLEAMLAYQKANGVTRAAVIGGGLLGLEAAKAMQDIGCETHIIEFAPILMCRQIDQGGHDALVGKIEAMGLEVHCDARTETIGGAGEDGPVTHLSFSNEGWDNLDVGMVIVSAGIKPRDEIARDAGLTLGERGGVLIDEACRTSDPSVYAIGECALFQGMIYGLVAPGYDMANVAAQQVIGGESDAAPLFSAADLSTKLKLLGVDVASFGENQPPKDDKDQSSLVWNDPVSGIYRKLIFNKAGTKLRGGILVGDAEDFTELHALTKQGALDDGMAPATLLSPSSVQAASGAPVEKKGPPVDPAAQICSCNDVSRGALDAAIASGEDTFGKLKACTKAGAGCGGCEPLVKAVLAQELEKSGLKASTALCEHFDLSRPELMALIASGDLESYEQVLEKHGHGDGCEVCKPAVASMLATLKNGNVLMDGRAALQDTNDRALANMQRGGSYSVVPRVPGGELLPSQLIVMGQVAEKYSLYAKITGAQRVDLFGAAKHQLPDIWAELGAAGLESGHAYGKALRTVKSCVGSNWCRYGVQDSVGFAIRVENRYKGFRGPHKMKGAVSGCIRECSEAQCKDFGMIATENGYNLYLGGNGGASPVHGLLFATDIDEDTVLKYVDRYLMYYALTAERLERTARWQERLPGDPLEHLTDIIIHDKLGLCGEWDARMQHVVDTYHDEWADVVKTPSLRKLFKQFVNTDEVQEKEELIEFIEERGQYRPMNWNPDGEAHTLWRPPAEGDVFARSEKTWVAVGAVDDFPANMGSTVLVGETQLAVFNNAKRGEWHATQNMCPHKQAFVLSQGLIGDANGAPKVACPLHKKTFALEGGAEIGGDLSILTFPVKIEEGQVLLELPKTEELDAILGTSGLRVACTGDKHDPRCTDGGIKPGNSTLAMV